MANKKRQVICKYIDGTVKAVYDSLTEATQALGKTGKRDMTHIIDVCRGRRKTAFRYKWEYC